MKFETKFDLGDEIFFLSNNKSCSSIVRGLKIEVPVASTLPTTITYLCNETPDSNVNIKVDDSMAFRTKKDLINSL